MITSSPGLTSAQIASSRPPVVPEVMNTWRSAWRNSASTAAWSLSRSSGMPWVTVYRFLPRRIASMAAALTGSGTSKSGCPIERLIGSFIALARSNTLRMPEASMCFIRSAIQASFT